MAKHTRSELRTLKTVARAEVAVAVSICKGIGMLRDREDRDSPQYKAFHRAWEVAEERRIQAQATLDAHLAESREVGTYQSVKKAASAGPINS